MEALLAQLHTLDNHSALYILHSLTPLAQFEERKILDLLQQLPNSPGPGQHLHRLSCCLSIRVWNSFWGILQKQKWHFFFPLQKTQSVLSVLVCRGTLFCSRVSVPWSTPSTLSVQTHINTQIAPSVSPRSSRNITSPLKQKLTKTEPQLPHKVGRLFFFTAAKLYFDGTHRLSCALTCPFTCLLLWCVSQEKCYCTEHK